MAKEISELDENMAVPKADDGLVWRDIRNWGVEGRAWDDTHRHYCRLPGRAQGKVTDAVWELAQDSTGMCCRFETDATSISARWTLLNERLAMDHMPASGVSGMDLYALNHLGQWRWAGIGMAAAGPEVQVELAADLAPGKRVYMLYLPLFNGVESVEIGVPGSAEFRGLAPRIDGTIVIWGTSIVHGGCASRPGMAYPAILGRRLDRPTVNLGFSGNGKMDPEVTELLTELQPAVFVIDCLPNMVAQEVADRTQPLVHRLRSTHKQIPIVLVAERTRGAAEVRVLLRQEIESKNQVLRQSYDALIAEGVTDLHYVPGDILINEDGEGMVDGSHPTDLGFVQMADALEPILRVIL